jgi:hypothetical protein
MDPIGRDDKEEEYEDDVLDSEDENYESNCEILSARALECINHTRPLPP